MTGPLPKEPLDPFHIPAPNLNSTKTDAGDNLNRLINTHDHGHSDGEEGDDFPAFEKLLHDPREVQEWQGTSSIDGHKITASPRLSEGEHKEEWIAAGDDYLDGNTENVQQEAVSLDNLSRTPDVNDDDIEFTALRKLPPPIFRYPFGRGPQDRDTHIRSTLNKPGNSGYPIMIQDEDTDSSSDDTAEEQDGNRGTLSTPSTSVAGSEAGIPNLPKKNKHSISEPPLPHRSTIVSLKYDKPMCEPEGGNHKSLIPGQSADDDKKDQQDDKEAEIADEEEDFGGDGEQNTPPVLYSTKRRPLSTVGEKAHMKRLSSPFLAESHSITHSKSHQCTPPRPQQRLSCFITSFYVEFGST